MRAGLQSFLKERYEKDDRYFRVYDTYRPDYKKTIVTRKFYSRAEQQDFSSADPELLKQIKKHKDAGPRDKYPWPVTENQWYGWSTTPLAPVDRKDKRFYHPRVTSEAMRHELKLKRDKTGLSSKSGGVPFKH